MEMEASETLFCGCSGPLDDLIELDSCMFLDWTVIRGNFLAWKIAVVFDRYFGTQWVGDFDLSMIFPHMESSSHNFKHGMWKLAQERKLPPFWRIFVEVAHSRGNIHIEAMRACLIH